MANDKPKATSRKAQVSARKIQYIKQLTDYLSNPENNFVPRTAYAVDVLHINKTTLYKYFKPEDLEAIEKEALEIRRRKYAPQLSACDKALLKNASETGDPQACKLVYQRFEGWSEKQQREVSGEVTVLSKQDLAKEVLKELSGEPHGISGS